MSLSPGSIAINRALAVSLFPGSIAINRALAVSLFLDSIAINRALGVTSLGVSFKRRKCAKALKSK